MAGASRASLSFASLPAVTTVGSISGRKFRLNQILLASPSPSFPSKAALRRKNYLRPKILKTLTKPLPTAPLPEIAPPEEFELPVAPPPHLEPVSDAPSDEVLPAGEMEEVESSYTASEAETVNNAVNAGGVTGKLSATSILKFAVFLVGFFVIETLVVVLLFGSPEKEERLRSSDKRRNLGSQFGGDGDSGELEEKISVIRAMAREARESERRQAVEGGEQGVGIENEVSERLVKLQKKLDSKRDKFPGQVIRSLGLSANQVDDPAVEDESVPLMFKKKRRFRSPSVNPRGTPKGFSGSKDSSGSVKGSHLNGTSRQNDSGASKKDKESKAGSSEKSSLRNGGNVASVEGSSRKQSEPGSAEKVTEEKPTAEATKSQKRGPENYKFPSVTRDEQQTNMSSDSVVSSIGSGRGDGEGRHMKSDVKDKKSDVETDIWWSKLPYVMAILMRRRGVEDEGEEGLYVLRASSEAAGQGNSYTLAFQDRSDANNFCFLLESFFEELGDFSADIVPLSVRELNEAVRSQSKKVFVVRKGQLKLYVGQPFDEVERALWSLIDEHYSN